MAQFLDNTIYTNYALHKICRNLVEDLEDYNFIHVKVGSGDNTLSADRENLSVLLYELVVQLIEYKDGIITIKCEIPPDLADVPITEIGLFDMVMGYEHLFSYSKVNVVKPADLGYELTIVLNLGPRTIDFPGINEFHIPKYKYVTKSVLDGFVNMFLYVDTNLERIIASNAEVIGYNEVEGVYTKQLELQEHMQNIEYTLLYYSLYSLFGNDLSDLFFLGKPNFLSYNTINFAKDDSFLENKYDLWDSKNDRISFNDGPLVLFFTTQLNSIKEESTIFNKVGDEGVYFSIDTKICEEEYMRTNTGMEKATFYELVLTIYGQYDSYKIKYIFDEENIGKYTGQQIPYMVVFNEGADGPEVKLFIDGVEPEVFNVPEEIEEDLNTQAGVLASDSEETKARKIADATYQLKSRAFGKVIIDGDSSSLVDLPDNSMVPLKNYMYDYIEGKRIQYSNGLNTNIIGALKRQANKHELALLNNILKNMI